VLQSDTSVGTGTLADDRGPNQRTKTGLPCNAQWAVGFRRTLENDLVEGTTFQDLTHFSNELLEYMIYYNEFRPHQALNHTTPKAFAQTKSAQDTDPRSAN
jgi:transposase InsO family protein